MLQLLDVLGQVFAAVGVEGCVKVCIDQIGCAVGFKRRVAHVAFGQGICDFSQGKLAPGLALLGLHEFGSCLDLADGLHHGDLVILPHVVCKFGQICWCQALSRSECIIAQLNVLHQVRPRDDLWAILAIHKNMNQLWLLHIAELPSAGL